MKTAAKKEMKGLPGARSAGAGVAWPKCQAVAGLLSAALCLAAVGAEAPAPAEGAAIALDDEDQPVTLPLAKAAETPSEDPLESALKTLPEGSGEEASVSQPPASYGTPTRLEDTMRMADGDAPARLGAVQPPVERAKKIRLSLESGVVYDDNIFLKSKDKQSDVIYRVSPQFRFALGDADARQASYVKLDYRPDIFIFQKNDGENSLDHDAAVSGQWTQARLTLGGQVRYQRMSGSSIDLSDRVQRDRYTAGVNGSYGWGSRTSVETSFKWSSERYAESGYADFDEWHHDTFFVYALSAKTRVAAGYGWGRLEVDGQGAQKFQQALARVETELSGKLSVQARGGAEFRTTDSGDSTTPVFGAAVNYKAAEGTTLALHGERSVEASGAQAGQNYSRTSVGAEIRQRMTERFVLSLDGGVDNYAYAQAGAENAAGRGTEKSYYIRPGVSYALKENMRAEAWYGYRRTDGSGADDEYSVNQAGFNFRVDF